MFSEVEQPGIGTYLTPGSPLDFSGRAARAGAAARRCSASTPSRSSPRCSGSARPRSRACTTRGSSPVRTAKCARPSPTGGGAGAPPPARASADAVAEAGVPVQRAAELGQRRVVARDLHALARPGRADRDVARVAAEAALELRRSRTRRGSPSPGRRRGCRRPRPARSRGASASTRPRASACVSVSSGSWPWNRMWRLWCRNFSASSATLGKFGSAASSFAFTGSVGPALGPVRADHHRPSRPGCGRAASPTPRTSATERKYFGSLPTCGAVLMTTSGRTA